MISLRFINGEFVEEKTASKVAKVEATLELNPDGDTGSAKLTFAEDAGLITRRTASRQASSICATGFLLDTGARVGRGFSLDIVDADTISEVHTREGHKYGHFDS